MAGDLDITRISAPLALEANGEFDYPTGSEEKHISDEQFETQDVSEHRRKLLEEAISAQSNDPKGKLIIERDEQTGRFVQKIVDPKSGDVIRQYPEEEFLELVRSLGEAYGLLVDKTI